MTDPSSPTPPSGSADFGDDLDRARDTDFDLRLVRYFIVVAEHRHFGRAAAALHVAQPSLSRQIRRLEQQLGARLLDRTTQGTRLTGAGEVFLPQARALLKSAAQAAARTRAAAEPSRLIIGYVTGVFVTGVARELRRRNPDADIQVSYVDLLDAREALLDHRADAVVARLPFRTDGLHVTILYDEPRVVLLPLGHRLAGREYVTLDDIAEEPLPRFRNADPAWSAYWRIEPRPDGRMRPGRPDRRGDRGQVRGHRRGRGDRDRHRPARLQPPPRHHHGPAARRRPLPRRPRHPRRRQRPPGHRVPQAGHGLHRPLRGRPRRPADAPALVLVLTAVLNRAPSGTLSSALSSVLRVAFSCCPPVRTTAGSPPRPPL